jgi:hypothetical protein
MLCTELLVPDNHPGTAEVFSIDPVEPMTISILLDKAVMPHNKAPQSMVNIPR